MSLKVILMNDRYVTFDIKLGRNLMKFKELNDSELGKLLHLYLPCL